MRTGASASEATARRGLIRERCRGSRLMPIHYPTCFPLGSRSARLAEHIGQRRERQPPQSPGGVERHNRRASTGGSQRHRYPWSAVTIFISLDSLLFDSSLRARTTAVTGDAGHGNAGHGNASQVVELPTDTAGRREDGSFIAVHSLLELGA